mmetsp:Transcript_45745/g.93600  ORF Transcript_45745/g.93600 Transcript_45745/m.93600 type:complete len:214 (+) Transcript_45745:127-768(+)
MDLCNDRCCALLIVAEVEVLVVLVAGVQHHQHLQLLRRLVSVLVGKQDMLRRLPVARLPAKLNVGQQLLERDALEKILFRQVRQLEHADGCARQIDGSNPRRNYVIHRCLLWRKDREKLRLNPGNNASQLNKYTIRMPQFAKRRGGEGGCAEHANAMACRCSFPRERWQEENRWRGYPYTPSVETMFKMFRIFVGSLHFRFRLMHSPWSRIVS